MRYKDGEIVYFVGWLDEELNTQTQWNSLCPSLLRAKYMYYSVGVAQHKTILFTFVPSAMYFKIYQWEVYGKQKNHSFWFYTHIFHVFTCKWNVLRFYCMFARRKGQKKVVLKQKTDFQPKKNGFTKANSERK